MRELRGLVTLRDAIRRPLNPRAFLADLKKPMTTGLERLSASLAGGFAGGMKVTARKGEPWAVIEPVITAWKDGLSA